MASNLKDRVRDRTEPPAEPADTAVPEAVVPGPRVVTHERVEVPEPAVVLEPVAVPIHVALARVMADVRGVSKNQLHNSPTGGRWKFRGIDDVLNAAGPALRDHGVIVLPEVLDVTYRDVTTKGGKDAREVTVRVRYTFVGPDGSTLAVVVPGESLDSGDKGTAKAMSVAFRIALIQALALPTDEPDPDTQAYQREAAPADPAATARELLLREAQDHGLEWLQVRKAFAGTFGHPLRNADAGELRAFTSELLAEPEIVLARGAALDNPAQRANVAPQADGPDDVTSGASA